MRDAGRCLQKSTLAVFAFVLVAAFGCSEVEAVTIKCDAPFEMTRVYEGNETGTLTVTESSGTFSLSASLERREREVDGELIKATGIRANGAVSTIMPNKAAIEECIKSKVSGELLKDADVVFAAAWGCGTSVPPGKEPVEINANVEIAMLDPPDVYVFITRTYAEPTSLAGGKIELSTMPPPQCAVAE